MTKIILIILVLCFTSATWWYFAQNPVVYHVVIVPRDERFKPVIPVIREQDFLIIINQSPFVFKSSTNTLVVDIDNKTWGKDELVNISQEFIPQDVKTKYLNLL